MRISVGSVMVLMVGLFACAAAFGQSSSPAQTGAAGQPAAAPKLLATVGGTEITTKDTAAILSLFVDVPPDKRAEVERDALTRVIALTMMHKFIEKEKVAVTPEEISAAKIKLFGKLAEDNKMSVDEFMTNRHITAESLRDQTGFGKLVEQSTTVEKVNQFLKEHPAYFDGSTVRIKQIVIACRTLISTDAQQKALQKLERIAADIRAGKITFEDAARKYSEDGRSSKEGGEVRQFPFGKVMPIPIAEAAFAMKVGEPAKIVRSEQGFHLICVIDRQNGMQKTEPALADKIAKVVILSRIESRLVAMAMGECPIVFADSYPEIMLPAKNTSAKKSSNQ